MKCFKFCKNKLMLAALALLMSFSVSLNAYAAELLSVEGARDLYLSNGVADLSDFWYTFDESGTDSRGSYLIHHFMFVNNNDLLSKIFVYGTSDSIIHFGYYDNSDCLSSSYAVSGVTQCVERGEIGFNSGKIEIIFNVSWNAFNFDTNIPWFDSKESAENYFNTGDTSGLLNPDNVPKAYSKDIETPKDLRVDMDADFRAQMGYAPGNGDEDVDASNSYCKFTWSQSDEVVEAGNYVTEIYYQTSFVHHSNPLCIGNKTFSLSSSKLVAAVPVDKVNMSYTMDFSRIEEIYQEWLDAGLIGGTMKPTYPTEPYYFYVRNVVGNTYGNWVRVTVNNDNVSVSNSITGANTVTGGYTEIDGSTATLPDVNQKLDGDVVNDSQYGVNYRVDIDAESFNTIISNFKNGFGLLGDNGALALISSCFSFLPEQYFMILVTFVAAASMVGLFLLFLGR